MPMLIPVPKEVQMAYRQVQELTSAMKEIVHILRTGRVENQTLVVFSALVEFLFDASNDKLVILEAHIRSTKPRYTFFVAYANAKCALDELRSQEFERNLAFEATEEK